MALYESVKGKVLNEAKLEGTEIDLEHFHSLYTKLKKAENELKMLETEFKPFVEQLKPMMDEMKAAGDRLIEADKYVIEITRFGSEGKSASYKKAYDLALTKVNATIKSILEEALEATKEIKTTKHSFTMSKKSEVSEAIDIKSAISKAKAKLKGIVDKFKSAFTPHKKELDSAVAELKKLSKGSLEEAKKKPSAGLTKKAKSAIVKKAKAGGDIGMKGKGFEKVAAKAAKEYGSKEKGEKVAAAAMWKGQAAKNAK